MIYLISGNGRGAGKTTLARKLVGDSDSGMMYSHAGAMRTELYALHPELRDSWYSTDQVVKDEPRPALGGKSIRDVMIEYGEGKCREHGSGYWARLLADQLTGCGWPIIAVDDVRKMVELEILRGALGSSVITHLHVMSRHAIPEPQYENDGLAQVADYLVRWDK